MVWPNENFLGEKRNFRGPQKTERSCGIGTEKELRRENIRSNRSNETDGHRSRLSIEIDGNQVEGTGNEEIVHRRREWEIESNR